jgi:hypothetical protein
VKITQVMAAVAVIAGVTASAQAMPVAAPGSDSSQTVRVAGGCGRGWHPNSWGRCVPNGGYGYHYYGSGSGYGWNRYRYWRY